MTTRKITYINTNDPVSAPVANRPLYQLQQEAEKLQSQLDTTEAGNTLIYRDIPCDNSVQVGMPVYWDGNDQCCKPAYVTAELNETTNQYETGTPADCIGLVYQKNSSYSADILVSGIVNFPALQSHFAGQTGRFYLGATPGSLTTLPNAQAFPLGVILGTLGPCDTAYRVYFNPCYTNSLLQHQHYSIDLKPEKWEDVPLDDENAPDDAVLAYLIEEDEELSKLWPPVPIGAVSVTVDWADNNEKIGGKELTVNKESSLIHINESGIYWMAESPTVPTGGSDYQVARVTLHFSKVQYSTRNAFVTSLQPDTNQPFKFVDCKGKEAASGDLYLQFTLNDDVVEDTEYKGVALKQFTEDWKSEKTNVVNGVSINGNALVTSPSTFTHNGVTYNAGAVKIDLSPYASNTEISPQIVKVGAAQEREVYGMTYLGLPAGRSSSLRLKFEIPGNYAESPISFKLRMQCISTIEGTYANATVSYYKVARATTVQDVENLAVGTTITCPFAVAVTPHKMFEVESNAITVNVGDTVIITISRASDTSYNADLAIARINGILNISGGSSAT